MESEDGSRFVNLDRSELIMEEQSQKRTASMNCGNDLIAVRLILGGLTAMTRDLRQREGSIVLLDRVEMHTTGTVHVYEPVPNAVKHAASRELE